ncbi:hypothetical protein GCM10023205_12040 [Yinghuangia aomiensis]|uniref:Aminoglycoside phosphotransferase domain-containing protein n=1 Tax=Yinghuangia aomiensis TaxID=676205 RepID=A0ABP9GU35_9ACTN
MGEAVDLRRVDVDAVLDRVSRALGLQFDPRSVVRKRRSIGFASDRTTWVRIERRPDARIDGQGWGVETAAAITGVAMPTWRASTSWRGADGAMWHADECDLVPGSPVKRGGRLLTDPGLSEEWWSVFGASMDALRVQPTTRVATPDTVRVNQDHVSETIARAFPEAGDTSVRTWRAAHADLNWANIAGPACMIFDWEDWGLAPEGLDAATLWGESLAVPSLAARVWAERREDLESHDGRVMRLFTLAKVIAYGSDDDPLYGPARHAAASILAVR